MMLGNAQLQMTSRSCRNERGGFVLLTLLFAASVIAAQIALTLPRAAMQAQRIREEKLIYRGEQYRRAIKLFYRKTFFN